ncbi:MAG: phosphoglucosamine mutase [Thermoanaerobaculia bacterium]|nr:phosphoglucosamine mutase [Thermoanaerobaculia bacterium]
MTRAAALFGTDGIRARFGEPPLIESQVREIAAELARFLDDGLERPHVVLGGDTRQSTPVILEWFREGLLAGGAVPVDVGVLPTPALAFLVRREGAAAAVAISASHNPAADNGIKLIDNHGFKWATAAEQAFEARLGAADPRGAGRAAGRAAKAALDRRREAAAAYLEFVTHAGDDGAPLAGLRVAVDAAHGAASALAGEVFRALGARVEVLCAEPDGRNINEGCGSTHPERLARRVAAGGFDLGFAFDGDADRALLVDERGEVRDGDAMLYLWASALAAAGTLAPAAIVATSMSNLGLEQALAPLGVAVARSDVGDREVVALLRREGLRLGGEQSGHLVDLRRSTTGDGLLTAVTLARLVARSGRSASELLAGFRRFPQLLRNVPVPRKRPFAELPRVARAARHAEETLGASGRLVLRYSGTEPLARIMLEGPDETVIESLAGEIETALAADLAADLGQSSPPASTAR